MLPWPAAIMALLAYASFANLDLAVAAIAWNLIRKKLQLQTMGSWGLLACLTALLEAHFPGIFEWNYGYTFYWSELPIYHLAELFGFQGLSSFIILINLMVLMAVMIPHHRKKMLIQTAVAFLMLNAFGWMLKLSLDIPDTEIKVGAIQANIGNLQQQSSLLGLGYRNKIQDKYTNLSKELAEIHTDLDFITWPETAFPGTISDNGYGGDALRRLQKDIQELGVAFIMGAYGFEQETRRPKNAIFALDPKGNVHHEHYFKTHLLAFGEYIPGVEVFPFLRKLIPASEFARGPGPTVIDFQNQKVGLQICYESLFPKFTLGLANQGAQWILNVTNDSWYGNWQEPYQHMIMTLARAVEVRRPMVRVTNTGMTTAVLANGDILQRSDMSTEFAAAYEIPFKLNPKPTIYQKWPWLTDALLLLLLGTFLWSNKLGRLKKH